jgi:hypothetical protein
MWRTLVIILLFADPNLAALTRSRAPSARHFFNHTVQMLLGCPNSSIKPSDVGSGFGDIDQEDEDVFNDKRGRVSEPRRRE